MVRLVFRPYTQILRSICTSEPLRASTRVSPGFTLFRHSSPSFGSQHVCSNSNLSPKFRIGRWCLLLKILTSVRLTNIHFHYASEFDTQTLAHMLDSLVRVSRRVGYNHFVHIIISQFQRTGWYYTSICKSMETKSIQFRRIYLPSCPFILEQIDVNSI